MKMTLQIIGMSILILIGTMLVNGPGATSLLGDPPYLWTRYITEPCYVHVGRTDEEGHANFARRHLGFPCWAMILDVSTTNGSWYAKVDLRRLAVNGLVALGIAGALVGGMHAIRRRRKSDQPAAGDA